MQVDTSLSPRWTVTFCMCWVTGGKERMKWACLWFLTLQWWVTPRALSLLRSGQWGQSRTKVHITMGCLFVLHTQGQGKLQSATDAVWNRIMIDKDFDLSLDQHESEEFASKHCPRMTIQTCPVLGFASSLLSAKKHPVPFFCTNHHYEELCSLMCCQGMGRDSGLYLFAIWRDRHSARPYLSSLDLDCLFW